MNTLQLKIILLLIILSTFTWAEVTVTKVSVKPRWPWNGLVDITYSIECDEVDEKGNPKDVYLDFSGYDNVRNMKIPMKTLTGAGASAPVKHGGPYTVTWDAFKDAPGVISSAFEVKIHALAVLGIYMVVNLETGSVRYTAEEPDLSNNTCRTTELWLRQIMPSKFSMGSPNNELGRRSDEIQHPVTLTRMFYIGVFQCTQKQWQIVMGSNPSTNKGDTRPVENVSYNMIRGSSVTAGAGWPTYGHVVDASSFLGKLQEKTGRFFDLPTEAEWECACRAGTTTALNSDKNLTNGESCPNMAEVGRYAYNRSDGKGGYSQHTKVGSYLSNAWGLYDMHGNVLEWCLDWFGGYPTTAVTDPTGPASGECRVMRGGCYCYGAYLCRSACRYWGGYPTASDSGSANGYGPVGFRVCYLPDK